jgi:hypothetical protein
MHHYVFLPHSPRRPRTVWRSLLLAAVTFFGVAAFLTSCGESTPSAASVLQAGQQQFASLKAFHFVLNTVNPGSPTSALPDYPLKAEGDVVLPNKLQSSLTISVGALDVTTEVIAIGNQGWFQDPISGKWTTNSQIAGLATIFNQQTGLPSLITQIDNPSKPADRSIGTTHCWSIHGTLAEAKVAALIGATPPSTTPLNVSVCIGQSDHEVYLITLNGELFPGDTAQTEHDITLSKFNESFTITAPPVG